MQAKKTDYKTEQEKFWAGDFGNDYIGRNKLEEMVAARRYQFSHIIGRTRGVQSAIEMGANVGTNLMAIHSILPQAELHALEINDKAVETLRGYDFLKSVTHGSFLEEKNLPVTDFSFTSGVLIHINPDSLKLAYKALYDSSRKYVMVCEYYNPAPVAIPYRGHEDRLFKRDFAGDMMDIYPDLKLVDYGFNYRRDPNFPLDDLSWFLMEKRA